MFIIDERNVATGSFFSDAHDAAELIYDSLDDAKRDCEVALDQWILSNRGLLKAPLTLEDLPLHTYCAIASHFEFLAMKAESSVRDKSMNYWKGQFEQMCAGFAPSDLLNRVIERAKLQAVEGRAE